MTCHIITGDGCIWEGISLMNAWMLTVVVSPVSLSNGVFKEKV